MLLSGEDEEEKERMSLPLSVDRDDAFLPNVRLPQPYRLQHRCIGIKKKLNQHGIPLFLSLSTSIVPAIKHVRGCKGLAE